MRSSGQCSVSSSDSSSDTRKINSNQRQIYAISAHPLESLTSCLTLHLYCVLAVESLFTSLCYFACKVVIRLKDLILQAAKYLPLVLCCTPSTSIASSTQYLLTSCHSRKRNTLSVLQFSDESHYML